MNIKFTPDTKDSKCYKIGYHKGKIIESRIAGDCHGATGRQPKDFDQYSLFFTASKVNVTEEMFKEWIDFCGECGFPSTYSIVNGFDIKDAYRPEKDDFYRVDLKLDEYVSPLHIFVATTAIRPISYGALSFQTNSRNMVERICELRNARPDLEPLAVMILAHTTSNEFNHFLFRKGFLQYNGSENVNTTSYSRMDKATMLQELLKHYRINSLFTLVNPKEIGNTDDLILKKQYDKIVW